MYSKAIATVEILFDEDKFDDDIEGKNGKERQAFAKRLLAKYEKSRDPLSDMAMSLEDESSARVAEKSGLRRINRGNYGSSGNELAVDYSVNSLADVQRLRDLFDQGGRSYDMAPYITASGVMLWLNGYEGPVGGLESSIGRNYDLDEWLEKQKHAGKKKSPRRKAAKGRARS